MAPPTSPLNPPALHPFCLALYALPKPILYNSTTSINWGLAASPRHKHSGLILFHGKRTCIVPYLTHPRPALALSPRLLLPFSPSCPFLAPKFQFPALPSPSLFCAATLVHLCLCLPNALPAKLPCFRSLPTQPTHPQPCSD